MSAYKDLQSTNGFVTTQLFVHNIPDYAPNYPFWVIRPIENQFWFYGAYSDSDKANRIAKELNGITIQPVTHKEVESS